MPGRDLTNFAPPLLYNRAENRHRRVRVLAVKVYLVDKHWEADARAWVVKDRREAQMIVYPVKERWDAQTCLYLVPRRQDAELKIFFARNPAET